MKKNKGFTLIELLVVILILGILSVISIIFIGNMISNTKSETEISNAKLLLKGVKDVVGLDTIHNQNEIEKEQFFIIKDNIEYKVDEKGIKTPTNYFAYKEKNCKFCIIKIAPNNDISIVYEGEKQDVKKDYGSNNVYPTNLVESREVTSLYNELTLFRDIYIANNEISQLKRFTFENGVIYEILNDGTKNQVFKINNRTFTGKIKIYKSLETEYIIETNKNIITLDNTGEFSNQENRNNEYSNNVIKLYDEIKFVAEKYIENNNITSEVYFEFSNGKINKVDLYGNAISDNNVTMDSTIKGTGELRINTSNQYEIIIYDNDNDNIKNNYGSDELIKEKLPFSRDVVILFKNLSRLELLAENYLNGATSTNFKPSKSDWLVFYYIRQLKYTGSNWNNVSSYDTAFVTYVKNNASYLKDYFTGKNNFKVNGDTIDLKHMAAVLATCMYQTAASPYDLLSQVTVDSMASWAGDLQTFMVNDLLNSVNNKTIAGYKEATMNLLGNSNTSFNIEDIYADTDGWAIYYNLLDNNNLTISEAFKSFYLGTSTRSYKNRFTSFKNTVLNSSNGTKASFTNLVYKFTKQNYEIDLILFTYTEPWPLLKGYTISSVMSQGVRDGFTEWIYSKIENE